MAAQTEHFAGHKHLRTPTLLSIVSSPLAVVIGLEPALLSAKYSHFLAWQEWGFAATSLILNGSFCVGKHNPAVQAFASSTALHAVEKEHKGKSPFFHVL